MEIIILFFQDHEYVVRGLISVAILLFTFFVNKIFPRIEYLFARYITQKTKSNLDDEIFQLIGSGVNKIIWLGGIYFAFEAIRMYIPEPFLKHRSNILYVILVFVVAHIISKMLQLILDWYNHHWSKKATSKYYDEFIPLFKRLIIIVVYTISIIAILHQFNQNVSSIVVSLGVGSLAVALAAKDTMANMIAGFMIMTDRPFRLGDRILLESGEKGDVYDIGLRSTKILTFDNTLIVVPNQQIINEKVTNLSYPDPQIRVKVEVGVAYGTDLEKAKKILVQICKSHAEVLDNPPPEAFFLNFGDSSLDLRAVCRVALWGQQWRVAEELRMAVYKAFEKEKIEIPFPQRVVYLKKNENS